MTPDNLLAVRVRFEDPDGRGRHFETSEFLAGCVVGLVPGPAELNWVLRLDRPIHCFDVKGRRHFASDFVLKPNGLDAEEQMRRLPHRRPDRDSFAAMAMILEDAKPPTHVEDAQGYRQFPMIGDVRIIPTKEPGSVPA